LQAAARPFDLCLLDIVMARMDGVTALRTLRAAGWTLPVIAATGNIADIDRERFLAEGFPFVLLKPFDVWQLHAAISAVTCVSNIAGGPGGDTGGDGGRDGMDGSARVTSPWPAGRL
jgi:CheY-like chemotaxis protein